MILLKHFAICVLMVGGGRVYGYFLIEPTTTADDPPVDCLVSPWSEWSDPFFGDMVTRTRDVLRYPRNGGEECPELIESKHSGVPVTVTQTADVLTSSFLFGDQGFMRKRREAGMMYYRDLVVIIDSSGSIGSADFGVATDQLAELLGLLCPKPNPFQSDKHRLAALRYASSVTEEFDFDDYSSTWAVQHAIRSIEYTGGLTQTGDAFNAALHMFTTAKGARPHKYNNGVKPEVLILTDGASTIPSEAISAAQSMQEVADVFAIVIGTFTDAGKDEILQYVSNPVQNHLFSVKNFDELVELVDFARQIADTAVCAPFIPY